MTGSQSSCLAQVEEFVRAELVGLRRVVPPDVGAERPLVARADAVAPMVAVGKAAAGPAEIRDFNFLERGDNVVAHAAGVRELCVFADPQAVVNAAAQMLGEMSVDVAVDFVFALVDVNDQFAGGGRLLRFLCTYRQPNDGV